MPQIKQRNSTNPEIGGMHAKMLCIFGVLKIQRIFMKWCSKTTHHWWNSERQKPRNIIANESMLPVSDGWFLTCQKRVHGGGCSRWIYASNHQYFLKPRYASELVNCMRSMSLASNSLTIHGFSRV